MPVTGVLTPQELEATIDTPAFGAAEQKVFTENVIPERAPTPFAPMAEGLRGVLETAGEAPFQSTMFPGGPLSQVAGVVVDPFAKALTGEPMNALELGEVAGGFGLQGGRIAQRGLTHLANSPTLTRRSRVVGPGPEYGFPDQTVQSMSDRGLPVDWYQGGKPVQLLAMGKEAMSSLGRSIVNSNDYKLMSQYGISPEVAKDYKRMFALEDELIAKGDTKALDVLRNEYVSQFKYNADVMMRRNPEAAPELSKYLYTNQTRTKASDLRDSGLPIAKLFGDKLDMPVEAIRSHISTFAADAGSFGDKNIVMSGSRFAHPMTEPVIQKFGPADGGLSAIRVLRSMPSGVQRTWPNIEKAARTGSFKSDVNISALRESVVDSDGYISFGGRSLSKDRQYGHYNYRVIVDKSSDTAYIVHMDEMKLGTGVKPIDKAMNMGGDESLGIEISKIKIGDGKMTAQGMEPMSGAVGYREAAPQVRQAVESAMADKASIADRFELYLKNLARGAQAYTAYKISSGDESP